MVIGDINEAEISDVLGDSLMFKLSPRHRPQKPEQIKALLFTEQKKTLRNYVEYVCFREDQGLLDEESKEVIDFFRS